MKKNKNNYGKRVNKILLLLGGLLVLSNLILERRVMQLENDLEEMAWEADRWSDYYFNTLEHFSEI